RIAYQFCCGMYYSSPLHNECGRDGMPIVEAFQAFAAAIVSLISPSVIIASFLSVSLGVLVGALPGLTATLAVSLLVGLTFGFDVLVSMAILIGVYVGG